MHKQELSIDPFAKGEFLLSNNDIDLILFDLDGLLVDTEQFHWKAYQVMCRMKNETLSWDFQTYLQIAGSSATSIRQQLQRDVPSIFERSTWEELYQMKKNALWEILTTSPIPLMQGVEEWIQKISPKKPIAVVTHSPCEFVERVRKNFPIFSSIDRWISREMYQEPKPAPDGYLFACRTLGIEPKRAIGFEDSLRGIDALDRAGCRAVLVNARDSRLQAVCRSRGIPVFSSFTEISCW
jgi:HAD superfamily hydrolase (TIGR01509 family)